VVVKQYTVRLYRRGSRVGSDSVFPLNLDDEGRLREVLDGLIKKAAAGANVDLSQYRMEVCNLGRAMVQRFVSIDSAGRTVVKR
jgi:hypothetical protein